MCLATPGVIVAISEGCPPVGALSAASAGVADPLWRLAEVDFGGVRQRVSLACLPEARVGDRVLVHVGLAISRVEEEAPAGWEEPPWL